MNPETLNTHITRVLEGLNVAEAIDLKKRHPSLTPDKWHAVPRTKFIALDIGNSGAFLVEKTTGELYNIHGYGKPDYNKKKKADIGNIGTVDPAVLHTKRWNYLR